MGSTDEIAEENILEVWPSSSSIKKYKYLEKRNNKMLSVINIRFIRKRQVEFCLYVDIHLVVFR